MAVADAKPRSSERRRAPGGPPDRALSEQTKEARPATQPGGHPEAHPEARPEAQVEAQTATSGLSTRKISQTVSGELDVEPTTLLTKHKRKMCVAIAKLK